MDRSHDQLVPGSNPGGPTNFRVCVPTGFLTAINRRNPLTKRIFVVDLSCALLK